MRMTVFYAAFLEHLAGVSSSLRASLLKIAPQFPCSLVSLESSAIFVSCSPGSAREIPERKKDRHEKATKMAKDATKCRYENHFCTFPLYQGFTEYYIDQ